MLAFFWGGKSENSERDNMSNIHLEVPKLYNKEGI